MEHIGLQEIYILDLQVIRKVNVLKNFFRVEATFLRHSLKLGLALHHEPVVV